uniref:Caspase domain-containing protein n=1 Tax=Candidatus Kentrum sp. FW TaxID=2126338 RepID=A0A450TPU0_9GAMM|nr:MAG: hypothetical protein BECKFW1821C_GA0114237_102027 [Candidatus Kentron sp. FW]
MRAKHVVLARTHYDEITKHTRRWSERLKQLFEESGWTVTDCEKATRESVEEALRAQPESLFVFYGHGQVDHLEGQDGNAICDLENANLLGRCKVYVMAGHSVAELGYTAVGECGALVYFGYDEFVNGYWKDGDEHRDMMDVLGECVNSGLRAWLAHPELTAGEIQQKMKDVYWSWIDYYMESDDVDYLVAAQFSAKLRHNLDALKLLGNKQTRLLD